MVGQIVSDNGIAKELGLDRFITGHDIHVYGEALMNSRILDLSDQVDRLCHCL
jgi:hypothetical protein